MYTHITQYIWIQENITKLVISGFLLTFGLYSSIYAYYCFVFWLSPFRWDRSSVVLPSMKFIMCLMSHTSGMEVTMLQSVPYCLLYKCRFGLYFLMCTFSLICISYSLKSKFWKSEKVQQLSWTLILSYRLVVVVFHFTFSLKSENLNTLFWNFFYYHF